MDVQTEYKLATCGNGSHANGDMMINIARVLLLWGLGWAIEQCKERQARPLKKYKKEAGPPVRTADQPREFPCGHSTDTLGSVRLVDTAARILRILIRSLLPSPDAL